MNGTAVTHGGPLVSSIEFVLLHPFLQGQNSLIAALIVLVASAFFILNAQAPKIPNHSIYFKNNAGKKLQLMAGDTRFRRFLNGKDMSKEGSVKFGQDPFMVKNGRRMELVVSTPEQVRDFLAKDATDHMKRSDCNLGDYFVRTLGSCVGVKSGEKWRTARHHLEPHFSFPTAASMLSNCREMILNWARNLADDPMVTSKTRNGFDFDAVSACRQLPFRLIALALYKDMLTEDMFEQLWALNALHEKVTNIAFFSKWPTKSFYRWLPTEANSLLSEYEREWEKLNLKTIMEARKTGKSCPAEVMYQGVEAGELTLDTYMQSLDEILFTNIDVTSAMMGYALISVAKNLEVQESLRSEILTVGKSAAEIAEYTRKEDTILHKTYLEVLRNNPPTWYSLPELTAIDKRIGGYLIPAGTAVVLDLQRLNKDSPVWQPDGSEFRPGRWDSISPVAARYSLHGYGMGPRKCLGKNFANIIIKLLLVTTLEEFTLSAGTDETKLRKDRFTRTPDDVVSFQVRRSGSK
ncbi:uncharacterized protein CIMG_11806 [Coccidioides immitis RS]|uniref:Cytochrome P450 monooxygenase n=1 Tax=Coccidioides immitis (strain RS) TaxID=246410 RepID=A0A0D8JTH0_COCIM|nr:uncharacterized protein CIMG_11806 [Coccidioides immitis RS]KJF60615.1 hypothetical protein CIMG_11806 [Coccidioides immitis RS]TPX24069.1 hypothetical protein DIZ76_013412 [Coccidioides immitis]